MKVYGCYTNTTLEFTHHPLEEMSRSVKCSGGIMEELENIGALKRVKCAVGNTKNILKRTGAYIRVAA